MDLDDRIVKERDSFSEGNKMGSSPKCKSVKSAIIVIAKELSYEDLYPLFIDLNLCICIR